MEPKHEFGKEAKERQLAALARKKRNTRRLLVFGPLVLLAILVFSFRSDIEKVLGSNGKNKTSSQNSKADANTSSDNGVTIVQRWDLPEELLEISGLVWMDKDRFACVQDEEGTVFIYNTAKESIEKEIPFAGTGDYEGLALVGENIWVIRADGHLYEITSVNNKKPSIKEYDTPLTSKHNTEGLCYDQKNNRLLIAIKDDEPGATDYKGIYAFNLNSKKLMDEPVMKINLKDQAFSGFSSGKKKDKPGDAMMPSDIAVHPSSGDIYIIEGRKPKLMIMDSNQEIKNLIELNKNEFEQPEGITFSPSGELFISNEGVKKTGNIIKLELSKK